MRRVISTGSAYETEMDVFARRRRRRFRVRRVNDKFEPFKAAKRGEQCFRTITSVRVASGGLYAEGSTIRDRDIATASRRLILEVIGIEDVTVVVAGGNAKAVDMGEISRDDFVAKFAPEIAAAAAA
jgi:FMN-dependent NADH-azoreductase